MTVQAAIGIVTLLYQAPIGLALLHQVMAIVVLSIAVVARGPHHARQRAHRAVRSRQHAARSGMIELTPRGRHRRSSSSCMARPTRSISNSARRIAAHFEALRVSPDTRGRDHGAGADVLGGRRPAAADRRRRRLRAAIPAGAAPALRHGVQLIRSRWSLPSTATPSPAAACWPAAPTSASRRKDGGRIGVTELLVGVPFPGHGVRGDALCDRAAVSCRT